MSPTLIIIVAVIAAILVAVLVLRGRGAPPKLPDEAPEAAPRPSAEGARPAAKAPEAEAPEAEAPEAKAPEAKAPEAEAPEAEAPETEAPEAEAPEAEAPEAEAPEAEAPEAEAPAARQPLRSVPPPGDVQLLRTGLASTRGGFIARLARLFGGQREIDPALLDEIEEILITADIGVKTTDRILAALRDRLSRNELKDEDAVWGEIRARAREILGDSPGALDLSKQPTLVLVVGVNGVGKTTTIGKLASNFTQEGRRVLLAAGDTFRAAAVLQLEVWSRRVGCDIVKGKDRADPASVVFEAVRKANEESYDVIIADTAGRLHTKTNLMEELKKVVRSSEKALGRPADEIILVLDSTTGQNAILQARTFKEALPLTGIVLTKLDGTAKGGVVLGIVDEHQVPVRYVGIGERVEDLREFRASTFVEALFEKPDDESAAA